VAVPALFAFIIGAAMFKRRVGGVYFAIITQAIAAIMTILIIGQQGYTGGVNGITDLRTLNGWDIRTDSAKYILYFVNGFLLLGDTACPGGRKSKLGRLLSRCATRRTACASPATTSPTSRSSHSASAAALSAIGGAMFTLQVGFMSPTFVGIVPSIEMVIYTAVGGRLSIFGAVYGTLLVNWAKTTFSETFPGTLAVRPRRALHRRCAGVPERSRRSLQQYCSRMSTG
jgi:urea transport system permease protein